MLKTQTTGRVWAEDPDTGRRRDLSFEEHRGFWTWAVVEVLLHTGIRIEELTDLSHHSLIQPFAEHRGTHPAAANHPIEDRRRATSGDFTGAGGRVVQLRRTKTGLLRIARAAAAREAHYDGKWLLRTSDPTLTPEDLAAAYQQLIAVERGRRDCKTSLGLRPLYHHREDRIRAHVQLCWLALLLTRVAETRAGDTRRPRCVTNSTACTWSPSPPPTAASPNAPPSPAATWPSLPTSTCPNRPATSTSHPAPMPPPTDNPAHQRPVVAHQRPVVY